MPGAVDLVEAKEHLLVEELSAVGTGTVRE
jgi:hypothetical protein